MGQDNPQTRYKIGEVAKRFGLNVRTLRYYEEIGLLTPSARLESGYRVYSEADAERLRFILQAKGVGFSLDEIQQILRLQQHGTPCAFVQETLSAHLAAVEAQITEWQELRAALLAIKAQWQSGSPVPPGRVCGLIEAWAPSSIRSIKEHEMTTGKRQVEVFTAGCPLCDPVVELVKRVACDNCEVLIHDLRDTAGAQRAQAAGVTRVPMVLVNGTPASCCVSGGPVTEEALRAAGVGAG